MRAISGLTSFALVVGLSAAWGACSSSDSGCKPGDQQACTCTDDKGVKANGVQTCGAGHLFGGCTCVNETPNQPPSDQPPPPPSDGGADTAPPAQNPAKPRGPSGDVSIGAGSFTMGCDGSADGGCQDDSKPSHVVTLTAFAIDKTEVSQSEYNGCVTSGGCKAPRSDAACAWDPAARGDFPVTCVSWDDAKAYCASKGKRLPTEAEWERAARGGGTPASGEHSLYPWGDGFLSLDCGHANFYGFKGCELAATDVVGTRPDGASPDGVLDMAGNVWEWVNDFYQSNYYASSPASDPPGPSAGGQHVARGGGYQSGTNSLQTTFRKGFSGDDPQVGFRCAK